MAALPFAGPNGARRGCVDPSDTKAPLGTWSMQDPEHPKLRTRLALSSTTEGRSFGQVAVSAKLSQASPFEGTGQHRAPSADLDRHRLVRSSPETSPKFATKRRHAGRWPISVLL